MTISLSKQEVALKGAEEMLRVTRMMSAWTAETSLFPEELPVETELTRVYRVGNPKEVYVERTEVVQAAQTLLSSVDRSEVRKLVAGTGTGKSTLLPVSLVMNDRSLAIVVMPNRSLAKSISTYVADVVCVGARKDCAVARCVDYDDVKNLCAPAVAYMAASDFLMMLASIPSVLERLRPSFVYVDEAHEEIPQYEVLQLLVSAGRFSGTKVFLGSATSSSQNLERREGGVGLTVKSVPVGLLMYDQPESFTDRSPMYHGSISNRTLLFVPSCEHFPVLAKYYSENALEVLELPEWAGASAVYSVERSLSSHARPVVVLMTQAHQTGYTFTAETVINCGVSVDLVIDTDDMEVKLALRVATEAESIQRCGRVGRSTSGVAYNFQSDVVPSGRRCSNSNDCYVALWCKLLNLSVNSAAARKWSSFVAPMSMYKICLLLSATVHPVVLAPFIAADGSVYRGTREIFLNFLRMQRKLVATGANIDVTLYTKLWQEQIMVIRAVPVSRPEFKTLYTVPSTWTLWSHVMYHALVSGEAPVEWFTYKRSVVSTIQDATDIVRSIHSSAGSAAYSVSERPRTPRRDSGFGVNAQDYVRKHLPSSPLASGFDRGGSVRLPPVQENWEDRPQVVPDRDRTKSWVRDIDCISDGMEEARVSPVRPIHGPYSTSGLVVTPPRGSDLVKPLSYGRVESVVRPSHVPYPTSGLVVTPPRGSDSVRPPSYDRVEPTSPYWATSSRPVYESPERKVTKRRKHRSAIVSATAGNLGSALLEPVGEDKRDNFLRLVASVSQTTLYKRLKSGDVKVSMLESSVRQDAFYAVLVMWNDAIATRLQLQAKPDGIFGLKALELAKVGRVLDRAKLLLKTFDVYGYEYQHQRYRPQASVGLDLSEVRKEVELAEYARVFGNDKYRDAVKLAPRFVTSLYVDGDRVGAAYKDGAVLFTALHIWRTERVRPREFELSSIAACVDDDAGVAVVSSLGGVRTGVVQYTVRRAPVVGESVSLFVPLQVKIVPVGFCTVLAVGDVCIYDANMPDGVSGSPLVAHADGAVVGIHLGALAAPDGSVYSQFASVDTYEFE